MNSLPESRFVALPAGVTAIAGGVTTPAGFRAAGVASGVKKRERLDLGLLASELECVAAASYTGNAAAAAPIVLTRDHSDGAHLQAVVVNSGNANACTGAQGDADAARMRMLAAEQLGLPAERVAVASTGLIGVNLPMTKIEFGIAHAAEALRHDGDEAAAGAAFGEAIRTTDKFAKGGALAVALSGGTVHLGFAAKGCGMISPNMATMFCFVTCDAVVSGDDWTRLVKQSVARTFNRITVDGQESTNDMVLAFCNGAAGVAASGEDLERLGAALEAELMALAVSIVVDGEGTVHTMRLTVQGAADDDEAESVARAIGNSPLVKTAFFGREANWGRIVQAIGQVLGRRGAAMPPLSIAFDELEIVAGGFAVALDAPAGERLTEILAQPEIEVAVDLGRGGASSILIFSDLSHDYVSLNVDYAT